MAPEKKVKKAKASKVPADEVSKVKQVKQLAEEVQSKKRKATEDASPGSVKKTKAPKAATQPPIPAPSTLISNGKKPKSSKDVAAVRKKLVEEKEETSAVTKKSRNSKSTAAEPEPVEAADFIEMDGEVDSDSDAEEDDQTAALLKGFESDDDDARDLSEKEASAQLQPHLDKLQKKVSDKLSKEKKASKKADADTPGVLYIGHIPHGFYEPQMKQYFKQFGDITQLRLSRNKRSGASKHFAFIEFASAEVAEIVAKTMDNYLLFNHILKVKVLAPEQVHAGLWKGANKRFKAVPWNKMEGRKLAQPRGREAWQKNIDRETAKRAALAEKMAAMGYAVELPELKSVADVPKRKADALVVAADEPDEPEPVIEETKAIEAPPEKKAKNKKSKKAKEAEAEIEAEPVIEETKAVETSPEKKTKIKKNKKVKA